MMNRIVFIDNIKAISILGIIVYHCLFKYDIIGIWSIFYMGVPMFFAVNGYLMLRKDYSLKYLLKKNIKILFLVIIWGIISTSLCTLYRNEQFLLKELIVHVACLDLYYCNYLWFLCVLIGLNFAQPVLRNFVSNQGNISYLLVLLGSIAFFTPLLSHFNVIGKSSWLFYYVAGYCLFNYFGTIKWGGGVKY